MTTRSWVWPSYIMRSAIRAWSANLSLLTLLAAAPAARAAAIDSAPYSADELVRQTLEANPQVRSAQAEYEAALHQVDQAYTPNDPQFSYSLSQTPNGFTKAQTKTIGLSDSFQFP